MEGEKGDGPYHPPPCLCLDSSSGEEHSEKCQKGS